MVHACTSRDGDRMVTVPQIPSTTITRAGLAQWLIDTCQFFGADLSTSLKVAGAFISDVEDTTEGARIVAKPQVKHRASRAR